MATIKSQCSEKLKPEVDLVTEEAIGNDGKRECCKVAQKLKHRECVCVGWGVVFYFISAHFMDLCIMHGL